MTARGTSTPSLARGLRRLTVALALLGPAAGGTALAAETLDGLPVGITDDGRPYKGDPDAPLTLHEYSDYLCPFCGRYFRDTLPALLDSHVRDGRVRIEFHHFPLATLHPTAPAGHVAAACAAEQGAVAFWRYHDALFARQGEWNRLPDPEPFLAALAEELELDGAAHAACRAGGEADARVARAVEAGKAKGFSGTPTFEMARGGAPEEERHRIVGSRPVEQFRAAADALLAGDTPPPPPEPPKPELPAWAKPAALAPDPERPGFTVSGDPTRGEPDARLVVVEFSDYQCPSCARHLADTQPALDEELIASGELRWVYKTLPLAEHANAAVAAAAAECAADQGRFAAMHAALFERQESWAALEAPDARLGEIAAGLDGIDAERFTDCLGSREPLERVLRDVQAARGVTGSVPAFVILDGEGGQTIRGRQEPERFVRAVRSYLERVHARDAAAAGPGEASEDRS